MVLADTSVWIDHFRRKNHELAELLNDGLALMHPFVSGELACGNLRKRAIVLSHLAALPSPATATDDEVLRLIDGSQLYGRGIGWIDAHLLASARLSHSALWTLDERLARVAADIGAGRD